MPKLLFKILCSFLALYFTSLALFAPLTQAAAPNPWYSPSFDEFITKVFDSRDSIGVFGERYTYAQTQWVVHSLAAIAIGEKVLACRSVANSEAPDDFKGCAETVASSGNAYAGPSAILASISDMFLTYKPASGLKYVADTAARLNLISEAKAQGFGFSTLNPIQTIWRSIRNISYLLLVFVVIALAFMIMFRIKISPQIVITIQSALPKLIMTIILITFSYAISGFIIDLSYILTGLLALAATSFGAHLSNETAINLFNVFVTGHPILAIFLALLFYILILSGVTLGASLINPGLGVLSGISVVLILLFAIILLIISIRIWWLMLRTFINIFLLIIFSPFMILLGSVGPFGGIGQWLRNLASNVVVFPVIITMMFLSHYFFWSFFSGSGIANWTLVSFMSRSRWFNLYSIPSGTFDSHQAVLVLPGSGGSMGSTLGFLVSLGLLFLVPHVANMIRSLIQNQPFNYGTAIGEAFGPGRGIAAPTISGGGTYLIEKRLGLGGTTGPTGRALQAALEGLVRAIVHR